MPIVKTVVRFESDIFDPDRRVQILRNGNIRLAKRFKDVTRQAMIDETHTGILYQPRNPGQGAGFTRSHRASARGERPAPDTMNLVNSLGDESISDTEHKVFVDDSQAPYAKWLQENMDRPIMTQGDTDTFIEGEGRKDLDHLAAELGR